MNNDPYFLRHLFENVTWKFVLMALFFALLIRFILCLFKSFAHKSKETNVKQANKKAYWKYVRSSYFSNSGDYKIDDYFLPLFIGVFELILFPLLLQLGQFGIIGGWLAFKAIGTWGTRNLRTAYNRFLFGNILSLGCSYMLWNIFFNSH